MVAVALIGDHTTAALILAKCFGHQRVGIRSLTQFLDLLKEEFAEYSRFTEAKTTCTAEVVPGIMELLAV